MAIQIKAASNLDCFAVARNDGQRKSGLLHSVRNDSRSSRVSETNVAIQIVKRLI